jgi:hypothetical protein
MPKRVINAPQVVLFGVVIFLTSLDIAGAGIVNGDFEAANPLEGWTYSEISICPYNSSNIADLHAYGQFEWYNPGWSGSKTNASLEQSSIVLQEGQTMLRFDAAATATWCAQSISGWMAGVSWGETSGYTGAGSTPIILDTWQTYTIPLLDWTGQPFPAGTVITIAATCEIGCPMGPPPEGHEHILPNAHLYVDNFQLVPEPATLMLLGLGSLALLRKHRA